MQIAEKNFSRRKIRIFRGLGFFHFGDQITFRPDFFCRANEFSSRAPILRVAKSSIISCAFLDQNGMALLLKILDPAGRHPNTAFPVFDFFRKSDDHGTSAQVRRCASAKERKSSKIKYKFAKKSPSFSIFSFDIDLRIINGYTTAHADSSTGSE